MRSILSILAFLMLFSAVVSSAIPTEEITAIRERSLGGDGSVSASDKAVIDKFMRSAIDAMFLNDDPEQVTAIRQQIRRQKGDKDLSMYASAYLDIARNALKTAYEALDSVDPSKKTQITRNLVILTAELNSLLLADFGISQLQNEDVITRYWAVKCIANTVSTSGDAARDNSIVGQLNGEYNIPETATKIYDAVLAMAKQDNAPEIQSLLINFAGAWKDDRSAAILTELARQRISVYQNWSVRNAWVEVPMLKALAGKYQQRQLQAEKGQMAQLFAELYADMMQRWMMGKDVLSPVEKAELIAAIVEVDVNVLPILGLAGGQLKTVLERNGDLQRWFDDQFGTTAKQGELATKLKFTYSSENGNSPSAPPKLGPAPASVTKAPTEAAGQ